MLAKIYDPNNRLLKDIPKGIFRDNNFVYKEGGVPILELIPILNKLMGFSAHEVSIECNYDERWDNIKYDEVRYWKFGDVLVQQPAIKGHLSSDINLKQIMQTIELSEARGDAIIRPPDASDLLKIGLPLLAILILIGTYLGIKGDFDSLGPALSVINVSLTHIVQNQNLVLNVTANNTHAIKALTQYLQLHNP